MRHLLALLILVTACGDAGGTTSTAPPSTEPPPTTQPLTTFDLPTGADDVVLQVDVGVNQPDALSVVQYGFPVFTLYGDGRLIATDRDVESGALPGLIEVQLAPEGVQALVAAAVAGGMAEPLDDYGSAAIGDAETTRFVLDTGDRQVAFAVYAVSDTFGIEDPVQVAAREQLAALVRSLRDWRTIAGEFVLEEPELFTGEGVLVLAYPGRLAAGGDLVPGVAYAPQRYETRLEPLSCQAVTGADYESLLPAITDPAANWAVAFRQIFPGEPGCEILPEQ